MADGAPGFHRWFILKRFTENGEQPLTERSILSDSRLDEREKDLVLDEIATMITEGLICRVGDVLICRRLDRARTGTPAGRGGLVTPRHK
jgi:hypothetical protein